MDNRFVILKYATLFQLYLEVLDAVLYDIAGGKTRQDIVDTF